MSLSIPYDDASISSTASTPRRKWRDLGMSSASNASSGIGNLMRIASRKSSESLRSIRSSASRKSFKSGKSRDQDVSSSSIDIPPVPALPLNNKSLPPAPGGEKIRPSSSVEVSGSNHDTSDPAEQPYEVYNLPSPLPTERDVPSRSNTRTPTQEHSKRQDLVSTPTQASITGDATPMRGAQSSQSTSEGVPVRTAHTSESGKGDTSNLYRSVMPNASRVSSREEDDQLGAPGPPIASTQGYSKLNGKFKSMNGLHSSASASTLTKDKDTNGGTQWASEKKGDGDGNTIAQLYAVFGLPKDPSVWTLAEEDCVAGVHHAEGAIGRFWRPEVLGCSICPTPAEVLSKRVPEVPKESGASKWSGRDSGGKKPSNPKFIEMTDGRGGVEKAETARVLSKALKLSFTREIEIVAEQGNYPPLATSHSFSFSVPTTSSSSSSSANNRQTDGRKAMGSVGVSVGKANAASGVGEGFGLENRQKVQGTTSGDLDEGPSLATFYGVVLTVWSAADDKRAKMIRKELTRAAKQRGSATTTTTIPKRSKGRGEASQTAEEEEDDEDQMTSRLSHRFSLPNSTFFMPYAICIVSRYPLYNLLGDWNKMAWHKYSRNIEMHNQLMSTILRHPAPRLGEKFIVGSPEKDLSFHCTFPGAMEWGTGLIGTDLSMWPIFKTLSLDNILTICEVALAPNGRVLFQSRHPALLGLAVETIKHLIELCGWRGVANQNCHARDVKIYLEDPGSWIIAINTELRSISKPSKEVCVVDLDINFVNCVRPPLGAISTKQNREKRKRRLMQAVFVSSLECSPPREYIEAYPGGRFRPLSEMITTDNNSAYEQLTVPTWWDQVSVIQAFDKVLREGTKNTFLKKVLKSRNNKMNGISESELSSILALRKRASTFVDARDGLENKIGRLNKRLAFLMSESEMWRNQFSKIQLLVDRLTKEANDLRSKVDKERRESRRLSSSLAQRDLEQIQIQMQLKETEAAREEAQAELLSMQRAMESLETEREAMMDEIRAVISGSGGVEDVSLSLSRLDLPLHSSSYNPLARSDSPTGSQISMTPSQAAEFILKSRAMAEAKISQGRPGRALSRGNSQAGGHEDAASSNGHVRSLSHDRGERMQHRNNYNTTSVAPSASSHVNHFPDDQMNYEIQQRTSVVTSQISRIQAQLENTLTQLEGRRSGTYERENERRRARRGSNTSSHSRYEYRTPSSLGHGGGNLSGMGRADSSIGHGSEDGRGEAIDYEPMENVKGEMDVKLRRKQNRSGSQGLGNTSSDSTAGVAPTLANGTNMLSSPSSSQSSNLTPASTSAGNVTGASGGATKQSNGSTPTSVPMAAQKSQVAEQRNPSNPWKQQIAAESSPAIEVDVGDKSTDSTPSISLSPSPASIAPPVHTNEIMLGNTTLESEPMPSS
ncbi:hypothetical protein CBS101457_006261 [Exobasidium rhododendri]|nr:hypothetical protein CBS101457_006261 [Exobasidium rhododendri]